MIWFRETPCQNYASCCAWLYINVSVSEMTHLLSLNHSQHPVPVSVCIPHSPLPVGRADDRVGEILGFSKEQEKVPHDALKSAGSKVKHQVIGQKYLRGDLLFVCIPMFVLMLIFLELTCSFPASRLHLWPRTMVSTSLPQLSCVCRSWDWCHYWSLSIKKFRYNVDEAWVFICT